MIKIINRDTTKITREELIGLIDTLRIDSILEDNTEFNQDELGEILNILVGEEHERFG